MRGRLVLALAVAALMWPAQPAQASTVVVPISYMDVVKSARLVNELKPAECNSINLTNLVVVPGSGGSVTGTSANDLILGGPNADTINGGSGDDCVVGGGGADTLSGGSGTHDICLGGAGVDTRLTGCETFVQ